MAKQVGVDNVRFAHGDLLSMSAPDALFAIVSCSGVLHHLSDPLAGWRQLRHVLAPHGVMKIGLYSTAARASVHAARAVARDLGVTADDSGLRAVREALVALPALHPARGVLSFVDFFSLSGLRDLVMHVQERTYTIPEISDALEALQLRFLGFQLPQSVQMQFMAAHPAPEAVLSLDAWVSFERANPDTFVAMYQFWCCHAG
jgi:SAM-dependent methyltransferase